MRPKILVTHPLIERGLMLLTKHYDVEIASGLQSAEELKQKLKEVEALICLLSVRITEEIMAAAPRLRIIANYAVGFDNIDVNAATKRHIYITNTPGVLTEATADLTWAALLALTRKVVPSDAFVRAGQFQGWHPTMFLGTDLFGKTLGIIGMGKIGQAVARRAAGFGMNVIYHDHALQGDINLGLISAKVVGLEDLLRESDFVSLHTPLTTETRYLLNEDRLRLMKPTAYLINTARGPVVEERALVENLKNGKLAGAALDVYEHEPQLTPGLSALENVVLLPHLGSATVETRLQMAQMVAENIHAALQGKVPPNAVNAA